MTVANAPIILKVELQELTTQPTVEAELVAAALTMKEEAVFCSNMMSELGFDKSFGSVPLHIDSTSALYIAGVSLLVESPALRRDMKRYIGAQE